MHRIAAGRSVGQRVIARGPSTLSLVFNSHTHLTSSLRWRSSSSGNGKQQPTAKPAAKQQTSDADTAAKKQKSIADLATPDTQGTAPPKPSSPPTPPTASSATVKPTIPEPPCPKEQPPLSATNPASTASSNAKAGPISPPSDSPPASAGQPATRASISDSSPSPPGKNKAENPIAVSSSPPPSPKSKEEVTPKVVPRGFRHFYAEGLPRQADTSSAVAYRGVTPAEAELLRKRQKESRWKRWTVLTAVLGGAAALNILQNWSLEDIQKWIVHSSWLVPHTTLVAVDHYAHGGAVPLAAVSDEDGQVDAEVAAAARAPFLAIRENSRSVFVDLGAHRARHYDQEGYLVGITSFIDVTAFRRHLSGWRTTVQQTVKRGDATPIDDSAPATAATESGDTTPTATTLVEVPPDVYYTVSSYFPFAAIAFLWLLPVLASVHRNLNSQLRLANIAAKMSPPSVARFKPQAGIKTRLQDVAGLTEVKKEVTEIIHYLKHPAQYARLGARVPRGVLIDGPPGVGKTLLAKAVAGEAKLPFLSCSGSEFDEVYVGVGAKRVRELFATAKKHKPCVIFIDEIDTFGRKRRNDRSGSSRATINALLNELDGFTESSDIMVLAATNRADTLDEALTRSGRFDRKISVDLPPLKDRVEIAKVHLKPLKLHPSLALAPLAETVATMTPGCSGADIYNISNEAAITASRLKKEAVDLECFYKAMDRIMIGLEKRAKRLSPSERERLAFHEAGHVVLTWFQETPDPVLKSTISPRGGHTEGVTKKLPKDRYISTQKMLREKMIHTLGGFVSEEFFFEDVSSSAADDMQRMTDLAHQEVTIYGMAPATVGHFGWQPDNNAVQKPYSEAKADVVDKTVESIADEVLAKARALLREHLDQVRIVAGMLVKDETVTARDLWTVLGERPHMSEEFRNYLETAAT